MLSRVILSVALLATVYTLAYLAGGWRACGAVALAYVLHPWTHSRVSREECRRLRHEAAELADCRQAWKQFQSRNAS